tara:strand:+ start:10688 stop:10810 length:123 start_codon:yes stop_codon:yes gene_type:complete
MNETDRLRAKVRIGCTLLQVDAAMMCSLCASVATWHLNRA